MKNPERTEATIDKIYYMMDMDPDALLTPQGLKNILFESMPTTARDYIVYIKTLNSLNKL
jgi:hypothetical protein